MTAFVTGRINLVRSAIYLAAALPALWLGAMLAEDANTDALRMADPVTGRIKACFTILDLKLGYLTPADWTRGAEGASATVLLLVAAVSLFFAVRELRAARRQSTARESIP